MNVAPGFTGGVDLVTVLLEWVRSAEPPINDGQASVSTASAA
jgi:hypothetical protein